MMKERTFDPGSKQLPVCLLLAIFLCGAVSYAHSFPFHEDFEGSGSAFTFVSGSGWGVVESDDNRRSYNHTRFLGNHAVRFPSPGMYKSGVCARTTGTIAVPRQGGPVGLSFWYRSDLFPGEKVTVSVQHTVRNCLFFFCWNREVVEPVAVFTADRNTGLAHDWKYIPLAAYAGRDIRILISQNDGGSSLGRGVFIMDDVRIDYRPGEDADQDGIPDAYDPTPNGERLPPVSGITAEQTGAPFVRLAWEIMDSQPLLAGFRVYRAEAGWDEEILISGEKTALGPEAVSFMDTAVRNGATYAYRVVALAVDGREGLSPPSPAEIIIEYSPPISVPCEEHFDAVSNGFAVPPQSRWTVTDDYGEWVSFSCNRHLGTHYRDGGPEGPGVARVDLAVMKNRVHIPADAQSPAVSFWYKSDLSGLSDGYFDDWSFWDYLIHWQAIYSLYSGNRVIVDIHYSGSADSGSGHEPGSGENMEGIDRYVRVFNAWPAESNYTWTSIPLEKYRGRNISVIFRLETTPGSPSGRFVVDDFRVSELPTEDRNRNRVPDEYETPLNPDMLPFIKDFSAEMTADGAVEITWAPLDRFPLAGRPSLETAGYVIYRAPATGSEFERINAEPIHYTEGSWTDGSLCAAGEYYYCLVAISTDNVEGHAGPRESVYFEGGGPPVIVVQPPDQSVAAGELVVFSVTATGNDLHYQWRRFGTNIPNAVEAEYIIDDPGLSYHGSVFDCLILNPSGSVISRPATLSVSDLTPPGLMLDGETNITVEVNRIIITGLVTDTGSGMDRVLVVSDRFGESEFSGVIGRLGAFSCEVPLLPGENRLVVQAVDKAGNLAVAERTANFVLPVLPIVSIISPAAGSTLTDGYVTVSGTLLSSLEADEIRLTLNDQLRFPDGTGGEYTFSFFGVPLVDGPNPITVHASTTFGATSETITVYHGRPSVLPPGDGPELVIRSFQPEIHLDTDTFTVGGMAESPVGIASITVNGEAAQITGRGERVSFSHHLEDICARAGEEGYPVEVAVRGHDGSVTVRTFILRCDDHAPLISLTGLELSPAVNPVKQSPFGLSGIVTDENLAGVAINGRPVPVLPVSATEYSFEVGMPLVRNQERSLVVEAWDLAGNRSAVTCLLLFDAALEVTVIAPADGAVIRTETDPVMLDVAVRAPDLSPEDTVHAAIDDHDPALLSVTGNSAAGRLALPGGSADHRLTVTVVDPTGQVLGMGAASFQVIHPADLPLAVVGTDPENLARDVEPRSFIAWHFNRPVNPDLLSIAVRETAHGQVYEHREMATALTDLNQIRLIDVNRDHEPVPGSLSYFPANNTVTFYPSREYAWGANVFAELSLDGEPPWRLNFSVRPLPTLLFGFVKDQFNDPVERVRVTFDRLDRAMETNHEGYYGFGFGAGADRMLPSGRYRMICNPGMENPEYGTVEQWVTVEEGLLNRNGLTILPFLNPEIPFSHISSGRKTHLASGGLMLDFEEADLIFPDGSDRGSVHVQFLTLSQLTCHFSDSVVTSWLYSIQPAGIEVTGDMQVDIAMPAMFDSHDYVQEMPDHVLIVGLDPASLKIVPVGVGRVDGNSRRVSSVQGIAPGRLDYLGYAMVPEDYQSLLEDWAENRISLQELVGRLEMTR